MDWAEALLARGQETLSGLFFESHFSWAVPICLRSRYAMWSTT